MTGWVKIRTLRTPLAAKYLIYVASPAADFRAQRSTYAN